MRRNIGQPRTLLPLSRSWFKGTLLEAHWPYRRGQVTWTSCLPVLYWPPSENASNCRYCVFLTFRVVRALFIGARARVRFGLMAGNVGGAPAWRLPFAQAPHLQDTPSETATRT
ncbi:hypothetical protein DM56_3549 [Burkholderia mallei]|nr:hypothetical protein DM75_3680 [Burkholderia mallei]KOS74058.1 hypothetical protein DM46_2684 [Burkholderia mallei]KOS88541.1 hypothetical protein DM49_731 [Burkholderia mallei]KOS96281.1 hypothetical protein DM50_1652 [Burkholderia mallei]KOT03482.1 hypothetical protein DM77_3068 [Burkholderia mallei]